MKSLKSSESQRAVGSRGGVREKWGLFNGQIQVRKMKASGDVTVVNEVIKRKLMPLNCMFKNG